MKTVIKKERNKDYLFKPGTSGNPKGRPRLPIPVGGEPEFKNTPHYEEVKRLAALYYPAMFNVLLEKGLKGEGWAQNLYYKEFIPKKAKEATIIVNPTDTSVDGQIKALTDAISNFAELSYGEAIERLKVLADLKKGGKEEDRMEVYQVAQREELMQNVNKLEEIIRLKKEILDDRGGEEN